MASDKASTVSFLAVMWISQKKSYRSI